VGLLSVEWRIVLVTIRITVPIMGVLLLYVLALVAMLLSVNFLHIVLVMLTEVALLFAVLLLIRIVLARCWARGVLLR